MSQEPLGDPGIAISEAFTDRVPEANALAESITQLRARVETRAFDGELDNVLTFCGVGGVGKTSLSITLQSWLELSLPEHFPWGTPRTPRARTVRWDLSQPSRRSDPMPFLLAFRRALNHFADQWTAFDIGLASLFSVLHPNDSFAASRQRDAETMSALLLGLAQDVGALNAMTGLSSGAVARVTRAAMGSIRLRGALSAYPELPRLLEDIAECAESPQHLPDLAHRVLSLATKQISEFVPSGRPNVVVFIDTFEKVQEPAELDAERLICQIVAALPHVLFVITGRNVVTWQHLDRGSLGTFGPASWPSLTRTQEGQAEPRQHLVGNLSLEDTESLIVERLSARGIQLGPTSIGTAVRASRGLPMHVDLIINLAIQLHRMNPEREITAADLGGSATDVVNRLISHLAPDAARALQGCAATPAFDVRLAAAAANVDEGLIQRLTRESLVLSSGGAYLPFQLHEDVRALIRAAGPYAIGGWTEGDWLLAARRALNHLEDRFLQAKNSDQIADRLHLHAAAVEVCLDWGMRESWVREEVKKTPSKKALSAELRPVLEGVESDELRAAVALNNVLALPVTERLPKLEPFRTSLFPSIRESATLWSAYALRSTQRPAEALPLLAGLNREHPESNIYLNQYLTTFAMMRRYRDLLAEAGKEGVDVSNLIASVHRSHGDMGRALPVLEARLERAAKGDHARAWRLELEGTLTAYRAECGLFDEAAIERLLESSWTLDRLDLRASVVYAMALRDLGSGRLPDHWNLLMEVYEESSGRFGAVRMTMLAGLRQLGWNDESLMVQLDPIRPQFNTDQQVWIPCELLFEHLDSPLSAHETQWLEPKEVVVSRWMEIFDMIVRRAKAQPTSATREAQGPGRINYPT